ncbi:hypothetical protein [Pseudonocardia sp. ICBG1293]|uniref:hypothetical protein n=1 Tax=Pseudonocardia sp. ICBG1293 TaxID=2844382 RepID=UPI001CCADFFC|nr:hypothetical protein [Pseudonocardia sp. ICBG1293]
MDEPDPGGHGGLTPAQRSAYRSFVRTHHPDRGGDPEVFRAGLARFRALAADPHGDRAPDPDDRRYDAPIEIVRDLPLPTRVLVALIRTVRRRTHPRVDRPGWFDPRTTRPGEDLS